MNSLIRKVELKSNLKLVEFFEEESSFYLVFEMMDGSLMERLNRLTSHRSLLSSKTSYQEWAAWRGRCEKYCKVVFNASPWPLSLVWYVTDFKLFYATISNTIFIRLWQASPIFPFAKQMAKERKFESLKLSGSSSPPWGTFTPLGYHTGKIMFHQVNIFKKCKHAQWRLIGK